MAVATALEGEGSGGGGGMGGGNVVMEARVMLVAVAYDGGTDTEGTGPDTATEPDTAPDAAGWRGGAEASEVLASLGGALKVASRLTGRADAASQPSQPLLPHPPQIPPPTPMEYSMHWMWCCSERRGGGGSDASGERLGAEGGVERVEKG